MYKEISKSLTRAVASIVSGTPLLEEKKGEYKKFFDSALKKFNVSSPVELKGDKKKEFFNYVDKNWTGETNEELKLKEAIKRYIFSVEEDEPESKDEDEDEKKENPFAKKNGEEDKSDDDAEEDNSDDAEEEPEEDKDEAIKNLVSKMIQDELKKKKTPVKNEGKKIKLSGKKDKVKVG